MSARHPAPALFLDRDGVIVENRASYIRSWADVAIYPQALAALARIRHTPYRIVIVTNQSAVGRGIISLAAAEAIGARLLEVIRRAGGRIDEVLMCPHAPEDACDCRKPLPGLLLQAAARHPIDLARSIMIGDALTDVAAGQNAGLADTILLHTGRGLAQAARAEAAALRPFAQFADLAAALAARQALLLPPG